MWMKWILQTKYERHSSPSFLAYRVAAMFTCSIRLFSAVSRLRYIIVENYIYTDHNVNIMIA